MADIKLDHLPPSDAETYIDIITKAGDQPDPFLQIYPRYASYFNPEDENHLRISGLQTTIRSSMVDGREFTSSHTDATLEIPLVGITHGVARYFVFRVFDLDKNPLFSGLAVQGEPFDDQDVRVHAFVNLDQVSEKDFFEIDEQLVRNFHQLVKKSGVTHNPRKEE